MKYIDNFLNKITMYKLTLWGLMILSAVAVVLSFFLPNSFPGSSLHLLESVFILLVVCHFTNDVLGRLFKVHANVESSYITALILFLLLSPVSSFSDVKSFVAVAVIAMLSKYVLVVQKKHVFNPAAVSLFIAGLLGGGLGIWWVGSVVMLPFVCVFGFLILRKVQRFEMFVLFAVVALLSTSLTSYLHGLNVWGALSQALISGPIIFFGTVMFTEPLTTPPHRKFRAIYAVFVGALFGLSFSFGPIYSSPQLVLIVGNILSFILSPRARLMLNLVEKNKSGGDIYDFVWKSDKKLQFKPGQYLEWTLAHKKPDSRGNRRYFTIASSPTEEHLHLGVRFYQNPSSFKTKLLSLNPGDGIIASQLAGDFVMPESVSKKLVFIAGGIGVTPFRSMAKYLIDTGENRDIVMLYSSRSPNEIAYKDIFDYASSFGMKSVYVVNDLAGNVQTENMRVGMIDSDLIKKEIPDYMDRMFYISGPRAMVTAFETALNGLGVKSRDIKVDFFPGFA